MQFDVIIGNPPYQEKDGGARASAKPLYHLFIEQGIKMNPRYLCMITPSRWFAGGKGLDKFRRKMLNDKRFKEIHDFPNASDIFPIVEIKGGVNYFLWGRHHSDDCLIKTYKEGCCVSEKTRPLKEENSAVLIRLNGAIPILHKVAKFKEQSFSEIVSGVVPFGFKGFFSDFEEVEFKNSVKIYALKKQGWVEKSKILKNKGWIDQPKILVPESWGVGNVSKDRIKPFIVDKNTCCTATYIVIGPFKDKNVAKNVMTYMETKFFHLMLSFMKITQHTSRKVYSLVPLQNFDEEWTDEKLYKKYGLTQSEIDYIERTVR